MLPFSFFFFSKKVVSFFGRFVFSSIFAFNIVVGLLALGEGQLKGLRFKSKFRLARRVRQINLKSLAFQTPLPEFARDCTGRTRITSMAHLHLWVVFFSSFSSLVAVVAFSSMGAGLATKPA